MKPNIGRDGNIGDHQPSHRRSIWRALVRSPRRTLFVAVAMTLIATIAAPAGAGSVASIGETTDAVTVWNANAGEAAIAACISPDGNPLFESRIYAITHVAIHDALNAIDRRFAPYVFDGTAGPLASPDAAVAAAARDALVTLIGQLPIPRSRRRAETPASRAWKRTTQPRSRSSRTGLPRRKVSKWERPPPPPSSRSGRTTVRTRSCSISTTRRATSPASIASRPALRSRSHRAGGT